MLLESLPQQRSLILGCFSYIFSGKVFSVGITLSETLSHRGNFVEARSSLPRSRKVVEAVHAASLSK